MIRCIVSDHEQPCTFRDHVWIAWIEDSEGFCEILFFLLTV